jgi:hypothetical protein
MWHSRLIIDNIETGVHCVMSTNLIGIFWIFYTDLHLYSTNVYNVTQWYADQCRHGVLMPVYTGFWYAILHLSYYNVSIDIWWGELLPWRATDTRADLQRQAQQIPTIQEVRHKTTLWPYGPTQFKFGCTKSLKVLPLVNWYIYFKSCLFIFLC